MATGKRCAMLPVSALAQLWGDSVEVRKSQVEGKKYPLYLSTKTGPVPFNTPTGQEFLLHFATFDGAPEAANDPAPVEAANDPGPAPETDPVEENKKEGFLKWMGDFTDG